MIDKTTLESLSQGPAIAAATDAVRAVGGGEISALLALPDNFKTHDLEALYPNRRRLRGAMSTTSIEHFGEYITSHAEQGATVFVNAESMTATAVLNLGDPEVPGHADNTASYKPRKTAEYAALLAIANAQPKTQQDLAEWLEDWIDMIECYNGENQLVPKHAIAAVRKVTIEAMSRSESTQEQLSASRSAFEQVKASSGDAPLPSLIKILLETYAGFTEREIAIRVSVLTGQKDPEFKLRIVKQAELDDELARELAERVSEAVDVPVVIGTYAVRT